MESNNHSTKVVHPGKLLTGVLKRRGILQEDLAWKLEIPYGSFVNLCNGKSFTRISDELAGKLEKQGILTRTFWNTKQQEYDEANPKSNGKRTAPRTAA